MLDGKGHVVLDGLPGDMHPLGYFAVGQVLAEAQDHRIAAPFGQSVECFDERALKFIGIILGGSDGIEQFREGIVVVQVPLLDATLVEVADDHVADGAEQVAFQ